MMRRRPGETDPGTTQDTTKLHGNPWFILDANKYDKTQCQVGKIMIDAAA